MIGIWYAAVYSMHHYIIDVILGSFCAIIAIFVFDYVLMKTKIRTLIDKYASIYSISCNSKPYFYYIAC